jgi:hypothetical protein
MSTVNAIKSNYEEAQQSPFLSWKDRPKPLKKISAASFEAIKTNTTSNWGVYNGSSSYDLCGISEAKLLKKIILSSSQRSEFWAMDIGAGNFQNGISLAAYINSKKNLPENIRLNIISLRGESYDGEEMYEEGCCRHYTLGAFKVEDLMNSLQDRGLFIENKVDLILSRWCFRHLADPVGTFEQTYNLLRPREGFLLMDGFIFSYHESNPEAKGTKDYNLNMLRLLTSSKAPFLIAPHSQQRSLDQFVLQRPSDLPCQLPIQYNSLKELKRSNGLQIGSNCITSFTDKGLDSADEERLKRYQSDRRHGEIYGERHLYKFFREKNLFSTDDNAYFGESGLPAVTTNLYQAFAKNNLELFKECIAAGADIYDFDSNGDTLLHIAIREKKWDFFEHLLEHTANLSFRNFKQRAPLHEAIKNDNNGCYIKALIASGASIKQKTKFGGKPIGLAIKEQNVNAILLLLQYGVTLTLSDYTKLLENDLFNAVWKEYPKAFEIKEFPFFVDNYTILPWLKKGNIVIIHVDERPIGMRLPENTCEGSQTVNLYFSQGVSFEDSKFIESVFKRFEALEYDQECIDSYGTQIQLNFSLTHF